MNDRAFDDVAVRAAEPLSRRASLLMLASAALAPALTGSAAAQTRKKNTGKSCKGQKDQCTSTVKDYCAELAESDACEDALLPCCKDFKECKADEAYVCILVGLASLGT